MINAIYDLQGETNRTGDNDPKQVLVKLNMSSQFFQYRCLYFSLKKRVDAIFTKLDRDHNGTLDENEFIDGCLSRSFFLFRIAQFFSYSR